METNNNKKTTVSGVRVILRRLALAWRPLAALALGLVSIAHVVLCLAHAATSDDWVSYLHAILLSVPYYTIINIAADVLINGANFKPGYWYHIPFVLTMATGIVLSLNYETVRAHDPMMLLASVIQLIMKRVCPKCYDAKKNE